MRIISGKHRGRRIEFLPEHADKIRPTSEFTREAIFNILLHSKHGLEGGDFADKHVLDIFCGTGAFGLEALSRGAKSVLFIDQAREAIATARHNVTTLRELENVDFLMVNAIKLPTARKKYNVVFLDPPYFKRLLTPALKSLQEGGWLSKNSVIVIEHDSKEKIETPSGFTKLDERNYGRTMIGLLLVS